MSPIKTPVRLDQPEVWPFDLYIRDADGEEIVADRRYAHSSGDKSVADVMACRDHGRNRDEAVKGNADQVAALEQIVRAVNAHDTLIAALKSARAQLEPFAAVAAIFADRTPQHGDVIHGFDFSSGSAELRVSHCVNAAKAIAEIDAALSQRTEEAGE